ncbi:MAG: ATP-dependent DNA helicase [Promethearchaeota archaeon]|nr:MAG: ATP-dependent DNA helicase [Candidatus Lokiarchaeota archaeon]
MPPPCRPNLPKDGSRQIDTGPGYSGRADTAQTSSKEILIQEIKSVPNLLKFSLESPQGKDFCAQLLLYAYYFHQQFPHHTLRPQLILMELGTQTTQILDIPYESLTKFLQKQCRMILGDWQEHEVQKFHLSARASTISFPFAEYRPHQREIVEEIKQSLSNQHSVMLLAPTGLGKTVGSLLPALQHTVAENLRLFVVTSKTTQQKIYADTLRLFSKRGGQFNSIILTAKEKMCINDSYLCDPHFCPYIQDYTEEKVAKALDYLLKRPVLDSPYIRRVARKEKLCPFELALDASLGCDVIVGDYNYVFNPGIRLRRYFDDTHDDCLILIDEAHNLPTRAREYYSPELKYADVEEVEVFLAHQSLDPKIKKEIRKIFQELLKYMSTMHGALKNYHQERVLPVKVEIKKFLDWNKQFEKLVYNYIKAIVEDTENSPPPDDLFLTFIRTFGIFVALLKEIITPEFQLLYYPAERRIQIFCKSAHKKLAQQMKGFYAVIAQSATLFPLNYYRKMLGLSSQTQKLHFLSPFPPENRLIINFTGFSTRYDDRPDTYEPIAEIIRMTVTHHPGNYLAFFPSFAYLDQVATLLEEFSLPTVIMKQGKNMAEKHRRTTLRLLKQQDRPRLLLGVHGGIFSEGVDYEGEMGIGVFVVGPGLPSFCYEQELIKDYFEQSLKKGFEYAYRNPGMTRVIQAAGRIFRSETDRGVVIFLGKRFNLPYYAKLFPKEWEIHSVAEQDEITPYLKRFW